MPGPFYFAYVDEGTAFNAAVHNVFDEAIYSFSIEHAEGDFAALELELKNPKIGVLNPTRKQWAYLSYNPGTGIVPLFYGRVVGVPANIQEEVLNLSFVAKPFDYEDQRAALAATYRAAGAPYWDPIWFDPEKRDDPANVLESRPELWHIDRVTHVVTTSHITEGEDGTLSFSDAEVFYPDMNISYGEVPLKTVRVTAAVDWDMAAQDEFNISNRIGAIHSYTGKGLVDDWPKAGANLGNGWKVKFGMATRVDGQGENVYYVNTSAVNGASDDIDNPFTYRPPGGPLVGFPHSYPNAKKIFVPSYLRNWKTQGADEMSQILAIMRWTIVPTMIVEYDVSRKYNETVTIELSADVQDILTDTGGDDILTLNMSSSEISTPIDAGGLLPIRDVRRRTYFSTDRGAQSIEYLIALIRARLLARARTVDITFRAPFNRATADAVSCRKNAAFADPRLPGGTVGGKIKHYRIALDGATGEPIFEITIGCTVGKGGTVTAADGTADYVDGVFNLHEVQTYTDQFVMPIAGEVTYTSINGQPPNDDGLDLMQLNRANVVKSLTITHTEGEQAVALSIDENGEATDNCATTPDDVFKRLDGHETTIDLVMKPVTGGPFLTEYTVETSVLKIPKTIDLEAASV